MRATKNQGLCPDEAYVLAGGSEKKQIKEYLKTSIGDGGTSCESGDSRSGGGWLACECVRACVRVCARGNAILVSDVTEGSLRW